MAINGIYIDEAAVARGRAILEKFKNVEIDSLRKYVDSGRIWLERSLKSNSELMHHGVEGQEWGVRNGPPYPLGQNQKSAKELSAEKKRVEKSSKVSKIVDEKAKNEEIKVTVNREKQLRHTKSSHIPGRSYLNGDLEFAQELFNKYSGTGEMLYVNGVWNHRERVRAEDKIGIYVDVDGNAEPTDTMIIVYSKTGSHIIPARNGG